MTFHEERNRHDDAEQAAEKTHPPVPYGNDMNGVQEVIVGVTVRKDIGKHEKRATADQDSDERPDQEILNLFTGQA